MLAAHSSPWHAQCPPQRCQKIPTAMVACGLLELLPLLLVRLNLCLHSIVRPAFYYGQTPTALLDSYYSTTRPLLLYYGQTPSRQVAP